MAAGLPHGLRDRNNLRSAIKNPLFYSETPQNAEITEMPTLQNTKESSLSMYIEMPILTLMALGTIFVFSAGANISSSYDLQNFYSFTTLKQLLFFPLAVAIMYLVSRIDYNRFSITRNGCFKSFAPYLLVLSIVLLITVLIPGVGVEKNFARRWLSIPLGPTAISFQPSELAKWAVVIFLAALLDFFGDSIKQYKKRFLPVCAITGIVCALIVTQDFGTAAFIACLAFIMLLMAGARWWHFLTPLPAVLPALYFAIAKYPHRIERLHAFFVSDSASPATYHAEQSLIAISTGGIWGKGLGQGVSKYGHLPEDTTDFIFAIISEELGFAGSFAVIALFAIMVIASVILIRRCNSIFGRMLASGIIITLAMQAVVNIGVVTVVLPTKGIPLPFVSAGGTSLLLSAAAAGILLNIARQTVCDNKMSAAIARMYRLIGSAESKPKFVSHSETVIDEKANKIAEKRVLSTRWAPFADDNGSEEYDIYEDDPTSGLGILPRGSIEDEVDISNSYLAYDEVVSMDGISEENSQVDITPVVRDSEEDTSVDAVSVDGNVDKMVSDDDENKLIITNPMFDIVAIDKPANSPAEKPQSPFKQGVITQEVVDKLLEDDEPETSQSIVDELLESPSSKEVTASVPNIPIAEIRDVPAAEKSDVSITDDSNVTDAKNRIVSVDEKSDAGKLPESVFGKEVTADAQPPDVAKKISDDFLFDADLETKAMRAVDAISWDEEEDPDDVWMPGSNTNSSNNKNFWDAD